MDEIPLHMCYKGSRNYLNGTDFYNKISAMAPMISGLNDAYLAHLVFRTFCRNDADICLNQPGIQKTVVGSGIIVSAQKYKKKLWIIESNRIVDRRHPYDEDKITRPAIYTSRQIILSQKTGYTPIEEAIALTKALSYKNYPNIQGKWIFGQLDLKQPFLTEYSKIHIEQKASVSGKFILNAVYQENIYIGDVRFIVGQP